MGNKRTQLLLFSAIWLSGFSGLTNQVIWQRALKLALGGAESLSAMVVVLVFMAGLGVGSLYAGSLTLKRSDHLRSLAKIEFSLGIINLLVWAVLISHLDSYFVAAQSFALSLGVPLQFARTAISLVLLAVPCCLMGMTTPLAAAALQSKNTGTESSRALPLLFFFNTIGGLIGAVATGRYFLPYAGQRFGLAVAILCNLAAAVLIFGLRSQDQTREPATGQERTLAMTGALSRPEKLAFLTGVIALAYEMLLFRLVSLVYLPLPSVFSDVLCLFLLTWSVGVWLSSRIQIPILTSLLATAASIVCMPAYFTLDRVVLGKTQWPWMLFYFIPVVLFGLLYGHLVQEAAKDWGRDVSRFYSFNTLGSCLGILAMTLAAFNLSIEYDCYILTALLVAACFLYAEAKDIVAGFALILTLIGAGRFVAQEAIPGQNPIAFFGTDGVVEIINNNVIIDGLWHSKLANGEYIGSNNWQMALIPLLAHPAPENVEDVLVVGFGTGITAHVFRGSPNIKLIEAYETNRTLKSVFSHYPEQTMRILEEPRLNLLWQDGRSGLELREQKYDIITSAPLYLKQAGSASLLSKEYFEKAARRLKNGGVLTVYSRATTPAQGLLVRKTLASVFPHTASIKGGYLLVGSMTPLNLNAESIQKMKARDWPLAEGLKKFDAQTPGMLNLIDVNLNWDEPSDYLITDDHPLVEYPQVIEELIGS